MTPRFTLRQLQYFVAVGEAGGIAPASAMVHVSPPSLSAAVAHLERELGLQLFVRHHARGLALTRAGREVFAAARLLLDQAEALQAMAADMAERPGGPLGIGCLVTLAPFILARLRQGFEARYPEARVHHVERDQPGLLELLRRAEIDIAITYDMALPQDVAFTPLARLPPHVLVADAHPLAGREEVSLAELAEAPMVLLDLPISRDYFLSLFHARGLRPRIAERTASMSTLFSLVAAGYGYGLANLRPGVALAPDGGALRSVRLADPVPALSLGLAAIAGIRRTRIVSAFEIHCRDCITSDGIPGMAPPA